MTLNRPALKIDEMIIEIDRFIEHFKTEIIK
jgi:hypothetical protein